MHALDQALARLRKMSVEMVLCAGDRLDVEPFGEEVVQRIKAKSVTCIRGNHDRWALAGDAPEARAYSGGYDLSRDTLTYLARLPDHWAAELEGVRVAMWHARPGSDMEGVQPDRLGSAECRRLLDQAGADVLVVGHTHEPFRIVAGSGKIVNPGACCSQTYAFKERSALAVPEGYRAATFGVLDLPLKRFRVFRIDDGVQVRGIGGGWRRP